MNKKALDQYTNFTEQREELAKRQTENRRAEDKIRELIKTLDMRKDEAVERTFKVTNPCSCLALAWFHFTPLSHVTSSTVHAQAVYGYMR